MIIRYQNIFLNVFMISFHNLALKNRVSEKDTLTNRGFQAKNKNKSKVMISLMDN